ncbi:NfeD family protein [Paenibacillus daejeonensis]|uniref:NfeD family protein n=1 Tax=Paenibacillus daejeonensis TaxID=135193 RepID=UPI00037B0C70|nr:NfeD family protein [Paenibacillus daejeonensis]
MEGLFIACLAGGILYALISVIFGDILSEALDGVLDFLSMESMSWLQPMTLVGGITAFGGAGLLLTRYTAIGAWAIVLIALLSAVMIGISVYFLYVKPMQNSENSTGFSFQELSGKIAEVLVPIPATGYGEVLVRVGSAGVTNQIAASHDGEPIPSGSKVVVVEVRDHTLYVSKLDL